MRGRTVPAMAETTVRAIRDGEVEEFLGVQRAAMLYPPPTERDLELRRGLIDDTRSLVAVDDGRIVGTTRCFATELTIPGGAVPAAAVTSVGVLPTHRRRGHLTGLMARQLRDTVERGEKVAMLVSAEWPIYGRYGYGVASEACMVELDLLAARFLAEPTGSVELVEPKSFREALATVYAAAAALTPGHMTWDDFAYEIWAGEREAWDGHASQQRKARLVVWRDDAGTPQAAASYTVREHWVDNRPRGTVDVGTFTAATPEAERELYRYLTAIDWASMAKVPLRPVDDPVSYALVDGRAATLRDRSDHIWLRILDVAGTLSTRTYAGDGPLVLEVVDPLGFAGGRFALDASPAGGTCLPTDLTPDVTVPVGVLGAVVLGGQSWARMADAGLVDEHAAGAVARASALFATPRAPYCPTPF
jgi:predicted acetyltransferase